MYHFQIKALLFLWMSSAGTGSWSQHPRMQPGRNSSPACEGLSNCPGSSPFWTGSLPCNFSCYLPKGKWSLWYTQGIPPLLQVTPDWELPSPRRNEFPRSQVSVTPPGRRDISCFHFCSVYELWGEEQRGLHGASCSELQHEIETGRDSDPWASIDLI